MLVFLGGCATPDGDTAGSDAAVEEATPSDSEVASAVETALQEDEMFASAEIDVMVDQGVVTLSGNVPNAPAFNRAISVARRVPGVRYVIAPNLLYTR
jgi:osmotically-inducible protein OsmY